MNTFTISEPLQFEVSPIGQLGVQWQLRNKFYRQIEKNDQNYYHVNDYVLVLGAPGKYITFSYYKMFLVRNAISFMVNFDKKYVVCQLSC